MFISKEKYNELISDKEYYQNLYESTLWKWNNDYYILAAIINKSCRIEEGNNDSYYKQKFFQYKWKEIRFSDYERLLQDMIEWDKFLDNTEALKKVNTKS